MPTKMRLRRGGRRNAPAYRVVVADSHAPRDGKYIDLIGHYDPKTDPPDVGIDAEKALAWLRKGVQPTETVRALLRQTGVLAAFEQERDARKRARARTVEPVDRAEPQSEPRPEEEAQL